MMVTNLYVPWVGGLEILLQQLIRELSPRGHEFLVLTSHGDESDSGLDEVDGTPVLRVPVRGAVEQGDAAELFRARGDIARATGDFAPDVVHAHDAGPVLWLHLRTSGRAACPLVVTIHNVRSHFEGLFGLVRPMLAQADWITGVSRDVVDDMLEFAPDVAGKVSVIRNGITPPVTTITPVPVDPPRVACIGRLIPQKGFDRAIDAFARLAPQYPKLRMTVAGDGPERENLLAQVAHHGLDERVDLPGTVDRDGIAELLDTTTAVVMPSRFEGLPLVALEAAWAGRPVVATRAPGLGRAIVDGETALVAEPTADALAVAIERLITDPVLAVRLGVAARALAEREFSMLACADAYEALYERLVDGSAPGNGYGPHS